jgi:glycosyltransferase involved in cell wall biosynthesis
MGGRIHRTERFRSDDGAPSRATNTGSRRSPRRRSCLLRAAALRPDIPVRVVGDGPLASLVQLHAPPNVEAIGHVPPEAVIELMRGARFLVVPSIWPETACYSALEALSQGTPVIATRLGALPELVTDGANGILTAPNDPAELAKAMGRLWDPAEAQRLGQEAWRRVSGEDAPAANVAAVVRVYEEAIRHARGA